LGWDPIDPPTEIGQILIKEVKMRLPPEAPRPHFNCSLGLPLDYKNGVDGYFILEGYEWLPTTIDLVRSSRRCNRRELRADCAMSAHILANRRETCLMVRCIVRNLVHDLRQENRRRAKQLDLC
jgi:hypothetical protein